jgi:hypothetical protein
MNNHAYVIRLTAPSSSGISGGTCQPDTIEADMADELEDPDAAAARLEAALERIARLTAIQSAPNTAPVPDTELSIPEIAERLDSLIGRLRAALDKRD